MKGFISFIIACAIYLFGGLVAWNIVCSVIDLPSQTLIDLADYRIYTYSGLTFLVMLIADFFKNGDDFFFVIALNAGIAVASNHWDSIWPSVSIILTVVYNVVNVLFMTFTIRSCFKN
jgi:hypothetical protein